MENRMVMDMFKKIAGLVLALVILAGVFTADVVAASWWDAWWDADTSNVTNEEYVLNRRVASHQISDIYRGFERERREVDVFYILNGVEHTRTRSVMSYIFPDFYAGPSFDVDGRLVISITESGLEQARNHDSIGLLLEAGIQYMLVEFSYAELLEAQVAMWENSCDERIDAGRRRNRCCNWCVHRSNMTWGYVCAANNRVVVGLYRYNEAMIAGFRRYVYDSPMIMFVQGNWMCLGGGSGSILPAGIGAVVLLAIVIGVAIVIKRRRAFKRRQSINAILL